jgi:hypothetical protein
VMVSYHYSSIPDALAHFSVKDVWHFGQSPSTYSKGVLGGHLGLDCNAQDWNIKDDKSSVLCDDLDNCTFQVWLYRAFSTHDSQDFVIQRAVSEPYQFYGFFNSYVDTAGTEDVNSVKGQGSLIQVKMQAYNSLVAVFGLSLATLLLFM